MTTSPDLAAKQPNHGLDEVGLRQMSALLGDPEWMLELRLEGLSQFGETALPVSGGDMSGLSFDGISYVPKRPGVRAVAADDEDGDEAEAAFEQNRKLLEAKGVVFGSLSHALDDHPDMVKRYLGKLAVGANDKLCSLNSAVWSGGTFIYVPPGIEVSGPLQAYSRAKSQSMGQFERTLVIADEGSKVHYIEGCAAPVYTSDSLHSAVVEVVVKPGAHVTYTTIQNWSSNVFNFVAKSARVEAEGHMEWVDGNIGARLTRHQPEILLAGAKASGIVRSVAYAGAGQHTETGANIIHAAPETSSTVVWKSISTDGGQSKYNGSVQVLDGSPGCKSNVRCDALVLDEQSTAEILPSKIIESPDAQVRYNETISKIPDKQLFYLTSRGLSPKQSTGMILNGFIQPVTRMLPMEYAVEWSRLIELQMEGSVG